MAATNQSDTDRRLWDGKSYPTALLRAKAPCLLDYLDRHAILEEVIPRPPMPGPGKAALVCCLGCLGGVAVMTLLPELIGSETRRFAIIAILLLGPGAWLVHLLGRASCNASLPCTVFVSQGQLVVRRPSGYEHIPLRDLYWFEGYGNYDLRLSGFGGQPCIILRRRGRRESIVCGLSEESRCVWREFLVLAEIERCRSRLRIEPYLILAGIAVGFFSAWLAAFGLRHWLGTNQVVAAFSMQAILLGPAIVAYVASVAAGNDWFLVDRSTARLSTVALFTALGVLPGQMISVDWLVSLAWIGAAGILGWLFSVLLRWITPRLRRRLLGECAP